LENEDNILQKIRELLGGDADNFSILEHQVDIKIQMEYFEFSKSHPPSEDPEVVLTQEESLYSFDTDLDTKRALLVSLASIDKPEAYRIIERYSKQSLPELLDWSLMALQESRMLLETRLLDEQQVFISTGLGGKGSRLRYFVVLFPKNADEFTDNQKGIIKSEFDFNLKRFFSEIEDINLSSGYVTIVALIPLNVPVKKPITTAINECNTLGNFVKPGFLITNVKILNDEEIEGILSNPPSDLEEE
jgi:hypothetical protein